MEYKQTLNITLSDKHPDAMPQRGNLPTREPEIQQKWEEIDLYRLSLQKEAPNGSFILHDGPPYSNGDIHLGHALNKIAKDIIIKYKTMQGYCAPYVPGWDNHGMPIENEVSKEFRKKGVKPDKVTMRKRCREYAEGWVDRQRSQFRRLGIRGDWDHPYLTMHSDFEAKIVQVFGELAEQGFIYRGLKPVMWCASCETALADAEIEYGDHTSDSIHVRFPVKADPNNQFGRGTDNPADCYVVIWTTTPWTIPANLAVAVHPDADYVVVEHDNARYLLAEPLAARTMEAMFPGAPFNTVAKAKGDSLEGIVAKHPVLDRESPVVTAAYVTMEDGTGIVHTAPGHGKEDFETGHRNGLEVLCPVDASGTLTKQAGSAFEGTRILDGSANKRVMEVLQEAGALMAHGKIEHSYPHCWRCHNPLLFRATVQWFMSIDHADHRQKALKAIEDTKWYPPVSINRISSMVGNRPDWCLSRQRAWGVGIPAFYCKDCGKEVLDHVAIAAVRDMVARETSDSWYAHTAEEILPAGFKCPHCGCAKFDKETDILDVWFDSGSTNRGVLENMDRWPNLKWPANVYLEGSDQHRGWFNSSLMIGVATKGRAPYDQVITNGWTLDETGRAMHKSWGNAVAPNDTVKKYGADILRLWVASTDYFEDVRCSDHILDQVAETYRRIRNTFRFLVNNLYDVDQASGEARAFNPAVDAVADDQLLPLDRWALAQLDHVVGVCQAGYEAYEFHRVYHTIQDFCAVELSAFYLDVLKDRLYCSSKGSIERRSAQTVLHTMAVTLARLLAPVLSHTAEEVWSHLVVANKPVSVQLADFPVANAAKHAETLARWEPFMLARERISVAIENARQEKVIGNPLEAKVELVSEPGMFAALSALEADLPVLLKVSQVTLVNGRESGADLKVVVSPAEGVKCARCWLVKRDVGVNTQFEDLCGRCADVVSELV